MSSKIKNFKYNCKSFMVREPLKVFVNETEIAKIHRDNTAVFYELSIGEIYANIKNNGYDLESMSPNDIIIAPTWHYDDLTGWKIIYRAQTNNPNYEEEYLKWTQDKLAFEAQEIENSHKRLIERIKATDPSDPIFNSLVMQKINLETGLILNGDSNAKQ